MLAATFLAATGASIAQNADFLSRTPQNAGLLARLNRSRVPALPGLPTASPLGLIAPRLSNAVSLVQLDGMRSQAGRLSALGILSPRVSPLVALVRATPKSRQVRFLYGLTILSPRATVLVGMLQASRGLASSLR
ncbi:MAG: hypothetical protein EBR23_02140 [Planctomycetia bacterium]|nr:hypothetical protein [Planctomycetia bacterium]